MKRAALLLFVPLLFASAARLHAFGKNKVIVSDFRWRVLSTKHFDIHFTEEAEPMVPRLAFYLEKAYRDATGVLGIEVAERTPFFFHVDHNQFEQNNIVDVGEGTGGVTEAFKNRFIVFNDGTESWLEHVIAHEFAHVCEFEVLYGGFWRSARLLKSPLYPLWFMEGLAEYIGGEHDRMEEDVRLRDAATSGRLFSLGELHGFNHLRPHEVTQGYKQGGAAVRFLADEYGRSNVGDLLSLLRERFEVTSIVADLTGQDFRSFDARYREYLEDSYAVRSEDRREPEATGNRVTAPDLLPVFNVGPAVSPDGRYLAYLRDEGATRLVVLRDMRTGMDRTLAGRQWRKLDHLHTEGRPLSFSPDGRWLAFAGEKSQRDYLYLYDLRRDRLRRVRLPFEHLRSPAFHPAEPRLAVSAMERGTNDLYEVTFRGKKLRRLTRTPADETSPAYSPDGRTLAYSVERGLADRDLEALDLTTLSTVALTNLEGSEHDPVFAPDGRSILFVSEESGAPDLARLDIAEGRAVPLTRVIGANYAPALSRDGELLVFSSHRRGERHIYAAEDSVWKSTGVAPAISGQPSASWTTRTAGPPNGAPATEPLSAAGTPVPGPDGSGLLTSAERPYRLRASTDLFFPLFFYSSTDGLFLAAYWQASEYLGNHALQTALQYSSGNDFLDYQLQYEYKRFRPQFFFRTGGENYFRDFSRTEFRRETEQVLGARYPLDRFHRIEVVAATIFREDRFDKFPIFDVEERENYAGVTFARDTTTGRYLSVTEGTRARATYQVARPVFGGDRDYNSHVFEVHDFTPTGRESTVAFRGLAGVSVGPSPQLFRLGGVDRLRGYSRNDADQSAARFVMTNLEWRFPIKYMNYYTWFIFPDFYFKAIYGTFFTDAGYAWNRSDDLEVLKADRIRHSVGAGVRMPVFILQTFLATVAVDVAKRTDDNNWVWYVSLGPEF